MRTPMPRLAKDTKTAIWFFRWTLPKRIQQDHIPKTLYLSLKTREARLAKCLAAVLNLKVEMMKKLPNLDPDKLRKLLEIDIDRGIFRADTPEELAQGLHIVETIGRIRANAPTPTPSGPAIQKKPYMQPTSPLFRKVADELLKELRLTLKEASVYKYKITFDAYIAAKSNRFLEDITREDIKRFKEDLLAEGKVPHTVNGHIGRLQALFDFALKNKYIKGENPAEGLHIPHSKKVIASRDKFYDEDLKAIYKWDNYGKLAITPDYFWGPLVCLFSGMRIEECTSLDVNNIKTDDGVLIMHIKDAKTPTGVRFVPIHPALLKLGFMEYVQTVKDMGKEQLFWYLSEGASGKLVNHNGTKKNLSRRFSTYLEKIGVKQDDNCFHSLRHTAITRLVARNVNNSTIYKLCGHKSDNSTHYDYLLSTTDHEGNQRPHAPEILEGSPALTIDIINSIERKHKYASGCIAFRPNEQPTRQQLLGIVDAFKAVVAPGLSADQFNALFVLHLEQPDKKTGLAGFHVHFVLPMTILGGTNSAGKNLAGRRWNPHPPGKQTIETMSLFTQITNHEHDWKQVQERPQRLGLDSPTWRATSLSVGTSGLERDLLSPSRGQWRHSHVQSHQADGPRTGNTQSQVQQTEYVRQSPFGGPNGRGRTTGGRKPVASTGAAINTAATLDEKIRALTIELNDCALGSLEARAITDELNRLQGERGRLPQGPAPTNRPKPR